MIGPAAAAAVNPPLCGALLALGYCVQGITPMKHSSRIIRVALCAALSIAALSVATNAMAHHSFAMFDRQQTKTITGTVKEFDLINPHGWLRVMVADAQGRQNEWSLELGGVGQQERSGWTQDVVHPGDQVMVRLHPLRDGSYGGQLISVTLPGGRVLGRQF